MGTLKQIATHIGVNSSEEFNTVCGVSRQAVSQAFNSAPYRFNYYYNCAVYLTARRKLKEAEVSLVVAELVFENLSKYEKEVIAK